MYEVRLLSFPKQRHERIERVVQKHGANQLEHPRRLALLHEVQAGQPRVIARYLEAHAAHNVALELQLLDAKCEVVEDRPATSPEVATAGLP